mmetsp:Transcript_10459/g.37137  ORF Transcript_10459/g.37137 Transcript_10459/m.37137 type:complete len:209 (+) Transcript_10459:274-900(+)
MCMKGSCICFRFTGRGCKRVRYSATQEREFSHRGTGRVRSCVCHVALPHLDVLRKEACALLVLQCLIVHVHDVVRGASTGVARAQNSGKPQGSEVQSVALVIIVAQELQVVLGDSVHRRGGAHDVVRGSVLRGGRAKHPDGAGGKDAGHLLGAIRGDLDLPRGLEDVQGSLDVHVVGCGGGGRAQKVRSVSSAQALTPPTSSSRQAYL